ncbi:MAG: PH domain-containing protein [Rikenellaceae bacterium]
MKYRSRISILLSIIILSIFVPIAQEPIAKGYYLPIILALGIPFLFVVLIFTSINYTLTGSQLIIRAMGCKMATIDIARIKTIKRSYNPLSSPAGSLKRLEIKFYHKGRVQSGLISPVREEEFINKLKEINPHIQVTINQKRNSILRFWDWDI